MTITYLDGRSFEAALLWRTENTIRVAVEGAGDAMELSYVNGTWVSENCEPLSIEFAWQRRIRKPTTVEADYCCSHELAGRLVHLLFAHSGAAGTEMEDTIESQLAELALQQGDDAVRHTAPRPLN